MSEQLSNKIAVVTGSGSGIGRAIAIRLSNEGAQVVVADFNEITGQETANLINKAGKRAVYTHVDCSDEASIQKCMQEANAWGGNKGIHILVNNAAAFVFGHLGGAGCGSGTFTDRDVTLDDWAKVLNTNIIGYAK